MRRWRSCSPRSATRDGGAGRRGRPLRFDSAPPSRVPRSAAARGASSALRRRPRLPAALFGPHAYGASFVGTVDTEPALRAAVLAQLNAIDDVTLGAIFRNLAGDHAQEVAMQVLATARTGELRSKASVVLQQLRAGG